MSSRVDRVHLEYQLDFAMPFHFGTGMRAGLIDRAVLRDSKGYLYVPGSTIKGVVREHCEQLARFLEFGSLHQRVDRFVQLATRVEPRDLGTGRHHLCGRGAVERRDRSSRLRRLWASDRTRQRGSGFGESSVDHTEPTRHAEQQTANEQSPIHDAHS